MKIIPKNLIKHLEWHPGQKVPELPKADAPQVVTDPCFSIDDLVKHGKSYYSEEKDGSNRYIGVRVALEQALKGVGADGQVASLPYLIAGKAKAAKSNYLWKNWFTALSEEDVGIDKKGVHVSAGKPVVITVHGGGLLTPERIQQAYDEGLTAQNAAKFTEDEFIQLLDGTLPTGDSIPIYTLDDVKQGKIQNPFGRYAVVLDYETAKATISGYYKKPGFMKNPLVFARAGTLEHLEKYFDKAKDSDGDVGNFHRLAEIDYNQSQGRVLFLNSSYNGLIGSDFLYYCGRFAGVERGAGGAK